ASIHLDRVPRVDVPFHVIGVAVVAMVVLHVALGGLFPRESAWTIALYAVVAALAYLVGSQRQDGRRFAIILAPVAAAAVLSAMIACLQWTGT
ncbi:hypothetical protein U6N05_12080, partial [Cutibacterium acnes]